MRAFPFLRSLGALIVYLSSAAVVGAAVIPPEGARPVQEEEWMAQGVPLLPHRANYFFPFAYNTNPHSTSNHRAQHKEAKFQLSFKILLLDKLFFRRANWYFGYTQLSMWQVYDQSRSAPFRDTNYEPETFISVATGEPLGWLTLKQVDLGLSHQSNGISRPDSRSWNRLYLRFLLDAESFSLTVKPWIRLPDAGRDDNSDISRYLGYGEVTVSYMIRSHVVSFMFRNNLRVPRNRGAIQFDYSFPLTRNITSLVQWFNGYGESLIDYNKPNNRFSIGLALAYEAKPVR